MDANTFRAFILLVGGVALIFYPEKVYKFQTYLIKKLHLRYDPRKDRRYYFQFGIALIIIAIALFTFSILY